VGKRGFDRTFLTKWWASSPIASLAIGGAKMEDHHDARSEESDSRGKQLNPNFTHFRPPSVLALICVRAAHTVTLYWKRPPVPKWLAAHGRRRAYRCARLPLYPRSQEGHDREWRVQLYPRDVEDALSAHPDVAMACVIGIPDPKWGEAVCALVVPKPGTRPAAESLVQLVKQPKGSMHAPKCIEFVDRLPLTPVGKVGKKVVRAPYWSGRQRMVG
jgi:fatty-acyl-CoA synthase